jgi:hypothetical protein
VKVYKYLIQEGVLYAKKDFNAPKHPEIDVPSLQVIKLMQSFKSKEYVKESFAWRHYYWLAFFSLHALFDCLFDTFIIASSSWLFLEQGFPLP